MGLLDAFNSEQGRFAMGLLAASAPRVGGGNFGRNLSEAMGSVDAFKEQQAAAEMKRMQVEAYTRKVKQEEAQQKQAQIDQQAALRAFMPRTSAQALSGGGGPTMANAETIGQRQAFDPRQFMQDNPGVSMDAVKQAMTMDKAMNPTEEAYTLSPGQTRLRGSQQIAAMPDKAPAQPSAVLEYEYAREQGYKGSFEQFSTTQKRAGASNVSVSNRVENKASESVAKQVGPILEQSLASAEGAMRVLDASQRVVSAIDTGKVITGPLANARVTGLQIGQMLGIGGKDDVETLANTRQAIRGLAEMTLQGRKEMSGQGAITNSESGLAEKATSGSIESLTAAEVKILANASARASRYMIQKHKSRVKSAGVLPGMENITPFFDVPEVQEPTAPVSPAAFRWNPQTKKVEAVK